MTPSNDIEDRFASAVKSALDTSNEAGQLAETGTASIEAGDRPKRLRPFGIVLLCLSLAAIAVVAVAAALQVRLGSFTRLTPETSALRQGSAFDQPATPSSAPEAITSSESSSLNSSETSIATPKVPGVSLGETVAATPDASATGPYGGSIAAGAHKSPTVQEPSTQGPSTTAPTPEVENSNTQTFSIPVAKSRFEDKPRSPLAAPQASPRRSKVSRQIPAQPLKSKEASLVAQADDGPATTAVGPASGSEAGSSGPLAKEQMTSSMPAGASSLASDAQRDAESRKPSPTKIASAGSVSQGSAPTKETMARVILVPSPDHSVYWALEGSGTIFRSIDRKTWQKQESGVRSELLGGQATSDKVCWVVGRKGTILLTVDGARWQRIEPPNTADIVSVSPLSADVADIVAADGSRLSTFDRGSNWQPSN